MLLDAFTFDSSYNTSDYYDYGLLINRAPVQVIIDDGALSGFNIGGATVSRQIPNSQLVTGEFFSGVRLRVVDTSLGGNVGVVSWYSPNGIRQVQLYLYSDGSVALYRGGNDELLGYRVSTGQTGGALFNPLAWNYFEVGVTLGTNAYAEIRVNGQSIMAVSGVNTQGDPSSNQVQGITFGSDGGGFSMSAKDYYICDGNFSGASTNYFLGDIKVLSLFPTGPGDFTQFTSSLADAYPAEFIPAHTSPNWQNVAHAPPQPTATVLSSGQNIGPYYNYSNTVGAVDSFTTAGIPAQYPTIYGAVVNVLAGKSDAGTERLNAGVISHGQLGLSVGYSVGSESYVSFVMERDPITGEFWTRDTLNAAQPAYRIG